MAAGGNGVKDINIDPIQEDHILYGAVVGGPDQFDNYYDIRSDWPQTEVRTKRTSFASLHLLVFRLLSTISPQC